MRLKGNEVTLKQAIEGLLETYKIKGRINQVKVREAWKKIMGSFINQHTSGLYLKDQKLLIKLTSSAMKSELTYAKKKIVERINNELQEEVIEEVIFI